MDNNILHNSALSIDELKFYLVPFVNSMPEGFLMIDKRGTIVIANSKCTGMFGYQDNELTGKNISILVPSMYSAAHSKHIEKFFTSPHARPMGTSGMQLFGLRQNGIHFPIEVSLGFYNAMEGMYGMAFVIDITNKQLLDNALKQSEQRFKQIFQSGPMAMCITHTDNDKFIDINQRFLEITKYNKEEVIGDSKINLETILDSESFLKLSEELETRTKVQDFEALIKTKEGKLINILLSVEKIRLSTGSSYIIMFSDITESKQHELNLLNAVVQGEEKERMRLSKELHDGLSPLLSSVRNHLEVLNVSFNQLNEREKKYFSNSISLLNNALDEVRTMSKDLMPSSLEDYGLITAIKQLCERLDKINNVKILFYSNVRKERFDRSVEIGLYRIAQEIINNALKYSKSDNISVQIVSHSTSLVLSIEDNGIGFLPETNMEKGLGLRNIKSRVKSLNGFVTIDSRMQKGTSITVEVPIK